MDNNKELVAVKNEVSKVSTAAGSLVIKDAAGLTMATEVLANIKAVAKLIKEKKEGITKPLNEALKNARDLFRPFEEASEEAEGIVKSKMVTYSNEVEEKNRIEQEKIAKKLAEGTIKPETAEKKVAALQDVGSVSSNTGAAEFRIVKKVVIENETLVPLKYRVIDEVAVRKDALAGIQIAGVKVVEEKIVASYSKKTEDHMGSLGGKK